MITLSSQLYCGFRRFGDDLEASFAHLNDEKAKATVDRWRNHAISTMIVSGEPISGFSFHIFPEDGSFRHDGTLFAITDPRGFKVHITRGNANAIIANAMLDKGEILQDCVWGLDGANAYLLPTNSTYYQNALAMTAHVMDNTKPLPDDDLEIGNIIVTKKGEHLLYGGRHDGVDLSSTNFNCRKFYLYRRIGKNGKPETEVKHSEKKLAYAIHDQQTMTLDAFIGSDKMDRHFRLGLFRDPEVTFLPHDNLTLPRYSHHFVHPLRDMVMRYTNKAIFRQGKNAGKIVAIEKGVAVPDRNDVTVYDPSWAVEAKITVTYQTDNGPVTFIFR